MAAFTALPLIFHVSNTKPSQAMLNQLVRASKVHYITEVLERLQRRYDGIDPILEKLEQLVSCVSRRQCS